MRKQVLDLTTFEHICEKAIASGGFKGPGALVWDISNGCSDPVRIELRGRYARDKLHGFTQSGSSSDSPTTYVDVDVPCRKCPTCLRRRAALWRERMTAETNTAARTWVGTITLSAESHFLMACRARIARPDFDEMSLQEQFTLRHQQSSRELTLMLKRIRKQHAVKGGLRYCLVAEAHKNGLPHYHLLLHEQDPEKPLRKIYLSGEPPLIKPPWRWGFTRWKLADRGPEAARYLAKYLAKDARARVRASLHYGENHDLPSYPFLNQFFL